MHALYATNLLIAFLLCWATSAWGQVPQFNPSHPLAQRLLAWFLVEPRRAGGPQWYGLLGQYQGTLLSMGSGSGWQATGRPGAFGELRFDGTDDRVDVGSNVPWDFPNTTFAVGVRFRSTNSSSGQLVALRSNTSAGGWQIRLNPTNLQARLYGTSPSNVAAELNSATATLNDGRWHTATVVFQTDTVTTGNNNIAIYVDGVTDQGTVTQTEPYLVCTVGCGLSFGALADGVQPLQGALDDIRIYNRNIAPDVAWVLHTCAPPSACGLLSEEPLPLAQLTTPPLKRRVVIE